MEKNISGKKNNFDLLAADISKKERKDMLSRMSGKKNSSADDAAYMEKNASENKAETKAGLINRFNRESFLKKMLCWVKSIFFNKSIEEVYNNAVVLALGKNIERSYPGLIDRKKKMFLSAFNNKLSDLKSAQDFFKKPIAAIEGKAESFYFLLAVLVMPEYLEEMKTAIDPYQYPLTKELSQDTKNFLLSRLDEMIVMTSHDMRSRMEVFSRCFDWFKMFSHVPLASILSKFTIVDGSKAALFSSLKTDYSQLAKCLANVSPYYEETMIALYTSAKAGRNFWDFQMIDFNDEEVINSVSEATTENSIITMFTGTIPVKDLGKLIYENSLYIPESFSSGDTWFQKYRDKWHDVFEQRWKMRNCDYKKESIKKKMKIFFGITDFMKFPFHPWEKYSDDAPFYYNLSLGFLNFYMKRDYQNYAGILNVVTLEGDFAIKENRVEFSDLVTDMNSISAELERLANMIAIGGEYGAEFMKYDSSIKNSGDREKLNIVMSEINETVKNQLDLFFKCVRSFENLILAMLGEKVTAYYGALTNLTKIMGHENREFREGLEKFLHNIRYAAQIISELKEVDAVII